MEAPLSCLPALLWSIAATKASGKQAVSGLKVYDRKRLEARRIAESVS
jgi:hypothetical protein